MDKLLYRNKNAQYTEKGLFNMDAIDRENKNDRFDKLEQLFTEEFHEEKLVKAIFSS